MRLTVAALRLLRLAVAVVEPPLPVLGESWVGWFQVSEPHNPDRFMERRNTDVVWWGWHYWRKWGWEHDFYGRTFNLGPLTVYRRVWDEADRG